MAKIETLQKRIAGKEKEITKLQKKLERIRKAEASGWEDNPYYYSEYDLKWATRDLENAQKALEDYRAKLQAEMEKANSRNIPAILEFLEGWKARMTEFYMGRFAEYPEAREKYIEEMKEFSLDLFEERRLKKADHEAWWEYKKQKDWVQSCFESRFGFLDPYISRKYNPVTGENDIWTFDEERLAKELKDEANRKYDFIIERTNAIVGTITDASGLSVGSKGDLNGYIYGDKGTAKVQTIGAGGYNIQCFHFRTLINPVK